MVKLPKKKKGIASGLTGNERVRKVVLGVVVAFGVGLGAAGTAQAITDPNAIAQGSSQIKKEAVLFVPGATRVDQVAYHYSHQSHSSHYSHQSHYSHYSSRW